MTFRRSFAVVLLLAGLAGLSTNRCWAHPQEVSVSNHGFIGAGTMATLARSSYMNPRLDLLVRRLRASALREQPSSEATQPVDVGSSLSSAGVTDSGSSVPRAGPTGNGLAGKLIVVDAGHGGHDSGATSGGAREKDINLAVALELRKLLMAEGAIVLMTRDSDFFVELDRRVSISNSARPYMFVSVHSNSCGNSAAHGIETYYYTDQSARLARTLFNALVSRLQAPGRYVQQRGFRVVRNADVPATLVEIGYITNSTERSHLTDPSYRRQVAKAIAFGIAQYCAGADSVCTVKPYKPAYKPSRKPRSKPSVKPAKRKDKKERSMRKRGRGKR